MVDFKNFVEQANKAKEEVAKGREFDPAERIATFQHRIEDFYAKIDGETYEQCNAYSEITSHNTNDTIEYMNNLFEKYRYV